MIALQKHNSGIDGMTEQEKDISMVPKELYNCIWRDMAINELKESGKVGISYEPCLKCEGTLKASLKNDCTKYKNYLFMKLCNGKIK